MLTSKLLVHHKDFMHRHNLLQFLIVKNHKVINQKNVMDIQQFFDDQSSVYLQLNILIMIVLDNQRLHALFKQSR